MAQSADDSKKQENNPGLPAVKTISGIEHEHEVSHYSIGVAVDSLVHDYSSRVLVPEYMAILSKYKVNEYYSSTLAHVCSADGKLGDKEKAFVIKCGESWGLTTDELNETLKGKDCSNEMIEAAKKAVKEWSPNGTKKQHDGLIKSLKLTLILNCIIGATQNGLVQEEYDAAKNIAKKLDIDVSKVKQCVNIIKAEKQLYHDLEDTMEFEITQ